MPTEPRPADRRPGHSSPLSAAHPGGTPWGIDVEAVLRRHPLADVVSRYGIALRRSGRTLVGRCPFHADEGRPNLYLFPETASFFCFRCGAWGDAIAFVRDLEGVSFREAVARLDGDRGAPAESRPPSRGPRRLAPAAAGRAPRRLARPAAPLGPAERDCLQAAAELYHNRLLGDPAGLDYILARGVTRRALLECRVGFAAGGELPGYLRWRGLSLAAARRVGLLRRGGTETLAGRVVVPELRSGRPVWMVGRAVDPGPDEPKYLGLPGRRPLLGWDAARAAGNAPVCVTEGVVDWLVLRGWGLPALALVGTHVRADQIAALADLPRPCLVLDSDDAGREAAAALQTTLGGRAMTVALPRLPGVKDVADLALLPNGRRRFLRALREATPHPPPPAATNQRPKET